MAPDRGRTLSPDYRNIPTPPRDSQDEADSDYEDETTALRRQRSEARRFIASRASEGQNFTVRGVLAGLGVGLVICFSNMYFGLQTGWVSSMVLWDSLFNIILIYPFEYAGGRILLTRSLLEYASFVDWIRLL